MELEPNFLNCDQSALDFIDEWGSGATFINAHTSGSTGIPKAISLLRDDMKISAAATNQFFGINQQSFLHCPLSCNYVAGKMMLVRASVANSKVDFSKELISSFAQPDLISIVPAQVDQLLTFISHPNFPKTLLIGGAPLSLDQENHLLNNNINAFVSYGMTETCSHVALRQIGYPVYAAMPHVTFSVDARNCLIINSAVMSWQEIVTNDVVELIDNKHFKWIGRFDNVINSGGVKVFPEEIESILRPFIPSGINFYITSCQHKRWGQAVVLVADTEITLPQEAINILKPAQRPKHIIVDNITFTSNNKVLRRSYNNYNDLNS